MRSIIYLAVFIYCLSGSAPLSAQNTQIRGFIDALTTHDKGKISFGFGEQDLFITSDLNDRLSFLGESVFKFTPSSPTEFSVSIERIVIKYNIAGNHNFLIGKHHTPLNYWNDTYHHGRVFFPTIERPLLFAAEIIPLHTIGASLQGHNLGRLKFGYDVMLGNGIGSSEIEDNDRQKSLTVAMHIRPTERLRFGASYYYDIISKGVLTHLHSTPLTGQVNQNLFTGSVSYFGKKFELLAESTLGIDRTDSTGSKKTFASYVYTGYRVADKLVPYVRFDNLHYQIGELYFNKNNITSIVVGMRYQINYLAVIKLEYQHMHSEFDRTDDKVTAQFAIGF
jgi:hypothetical protein